MSFGKTLAILREEKNIDRMELAKVLNISYSSVSKYETDIRFPDQEILKKIADYFEVSIDYLLGRIQVRNPYAQSATEKEYIFEKPAHDSYKSDLPEEAIKQIDDYIEFIKQKYKKSST